MLAQRSLSDSNLTSLCVGLEAVFYYSRKLILISHLWTHLCVRLVTALNAEYLVCALHRHGVSLHPPDCPVMTGFIPDLQRAQGGFEKSG